MRIVSAVLAFVALAASAGGSRAEAGGSGSSEPTAPSRTPPLAESAPLGAPAARFAPTFPRLAPGRDDVEPAGGARGNAVRFAQVGPSKAKVEQTSGNPSLAPFKWVGLLTEPHPTKDKPKQGTSCTAEFIAPRVLLTAGHCIEDLPPDPDVPPSDPKTWTFWLQYQNYEGIKFNVVCAKENALWALPANYDTLADDQKNAAMDAAYPHDFGMILVDHDSPTGAMPYALDWKGKVNYAFRVGYPENILDAEIVQSVPGIVFFTDALPMNVKDYGEPAMSSPNVVGQWGPVTDATQGMSGGAWVYDPDPSESSNSNILIAVTSFGPINRLNQPLYPGGTFAAYLTAAEFNPLFVSVSNGCK